MLVIGFIQWWYTTGWADAARRVVAQIGSIYRNFSIPTLLRTLFLPWRRIMSASDGPLTERMQAMVDNLVSRAVGFSVRLMALVAAAVLMTLVFVLGSVLVIVWPLLPPLSLVLILGGAMGGGR